MNRARGTRQKLLPTQAADRQARRHYAEPLTGSPRNVKAAGMAGFWTPEGSFYLALLGGDGKLTPQNVICWVPVAAEDALGLAHAIADGLDDMRRLEMAEPEGCA